MGGCLSGESGADRAAAKASKDIEKAMSNQYKVDNAKVKLLLLGAGESGKSTIFKQMRVLFGAKLTEEEKRQITPVVYGNTITSMKVLCAETKNMGYDQEVAAKEKLDFILGLDDQAKIDEEIGGAIKELWADPGVQKTWKRRAEFQIVESVKSYFNDIDRIMKSDYVPTQQDMLLARIRTSGIVTEKYVIDGVEFEMYDVGGQRNERKKWIHCFEDVTAVIFVAALSEYDQSLFEDAATNRMTEAITLFNDICNNETFKSSSMILFLNKKDLFAEKIKLVHIASVPAFADFVAKMGDADYSERGSNYFLRKFLAQNTNPQREIYHHATCATDSKNVEVVFNSCRDIIMRKNMAEMGM
jgi:GTPase SAR1 family protein